MGVNRIELDTTEGKQVLIDISDSTIKPETVAEGEKGYGADGEPFIGTMTKSGGLDTSDATATPEHVAIGKTFYAGGKKQTGNVLAPSPMNFGYGKPILSNTAIKISTSSGDNYYVKKGKTVGIVADTANFGDATASDVAKGKTFTSTAGLKVEGTYEPPVSAGGVSF